MQSARAIAVTLLFVLLAGCSTMPARLTVRSDLEPDQPEEPGFGLYSYILMPAPPPPASLERFRSVIENYQVMFQTSDAMQGIDPSELNITYLPVTSSPPQTLADEDRRVDWYVHNYDYPRAIKILRLIPEAQGEGPYIISSERPLGSGKGPAPDRYLYQDLSWADPAIAGAWLLIYRKQASKPNFWKEDRIDQTLIDLRNAIEVTAPDFPNIMDSLKRGVKWLEGGESKG